MRRLLCAVFIALIWWPASGQSKQTAAAPASASKPSIAEYFDTTKPITISGIVHGLSWKTKSPYVFLAVAAEDPVTKTRELRWALKGDTLEALARAGWVFNPHGSDSTLEPGSHVSATGYPAKPGIDVDAAIPGAPPEMMQLAKTGGLVHGIEITRLKDGKKFYFGPRK